MHNILNPQVEFEFDCTNSFKELVVAMLHPNPVKRPTVDEILKHQWLDGTGTQLTPLYRDTMVFTTHTEGGLSCRL